MVRTSIVVSSIIGLCLGCVGQAPDTGGGADSGVESPDAAPGSTDAAADARPPQTECYTEPVFPAADITDVIAAYGGSDWKDDLIAAMERRHPATAWLLDQQRNDSYFNQFSDPNSWTGMVGWLDTLSHEQTHLFNAYHAQAQGKPHAIFARADLIFYLPTDPGFNRSEIWDHLAQGARDGIYAPTYLQGSSGARGFNAMLDEHAAYLNELAAVGSVGEYFQGGVSLRDGSCAFLYFIELYLRVARTDHPDVYQTLQTTPVYVEAVKTAWLRTHYFLAIADAFPALGISDDMYRALMHQADNRAEIEMFIGHQLDDSSCLAN
ncbi:MAG TPA: hypothetical protein VML75_23170 [Kofleriaceae bacterium]|nr:hypothetical protein [Kofleriaceae bacterium]